MTTYAAVRTTGIYCQPGCGAHPKAEHVTPYESAAAAEAAGYRACLRCRPYRASDPTWWSGPELVCRAVHLISDGALDTSTERELGARLGVSDRHLRRLFAEHLGLTPDQLAKSRRTHFARRLLDDTDLSVTDIAYASGFGSARQLNRACLDVFRATPTALRAKRRVTDRLVADGGVSIRLPYDGPFDWPAMLGYFAYRAVRGVESVQDGAYRRTIVIDGDPGVVEVTAGGDHELVLRAHVPHLEGLIHVVQRVRAIFGLDAEVDAANAAVRDDAVIGALVRTRPGIRPPGTWDPFETGVRAIVGQQVSVAGANTMIARVVDAFGTPVAGLAPMGLTDTFPDPATLAAARPEQLMTLGFTEARAHAIINFASAVALDDVRLDRSVDLEDFVASMTAVVGIGPWTAHYVALRMGERDAFPNSDLGLVRTASAIDARITTPRELAHRAEAWRPWRAHAATHLWLRPDEKGTTHEDLRDLDALAHR